MYRVGDNVTLPIGVIGKVLFKENLVNNNIYDQEDDYNIYSVNYYDPAYNAFRITKFKGKDLKVDTQLKRDNAINQILNVSSRG